jgi:catalase
MASMGEQLVDAINAVGGRHDGFRAVHAKGVVATGTFTGTSEGAELCAAEHLQGASVPVTVRFSNGGSDPLAPDGGRDGRGMATKFHLPSGGSTDIVALSMPVFFVRTPDDFLSFMAARVPDPATGQPDPAAIGAFLADHPEAVPAIEHVLTAEAPASYAQCRYFAIHAFWWTGPDGTRRAIRYQWEPDAGVETIADDDASARAAAFLQTELGERLAAGPARFSLVVQVGRADDPVDDPTAAWPDDRDRITVGTLELTALAEDQAAAHALIWDPTRVTDGIECTEDPIVHARSAAYGVSYRRRSQPA